MAPREQSLRLVYSVPTEFARCGRHKKQRCPVPECVAEAQSAAPGPTIEPPPIVKRATVKVRKAALVSDVSDDVDHVPVTHAERQRRWRKKNPKKHAAQQQAARARRKEKA